jgi:phosphohistidine phosphatase SixA
MTTEKIRYWNLLICGVMALEASLAQEQKAVTTCIIVRHAEKDTAGDDPDLSNQGWERAGVLKRTLAPVRIDAVYVTQYRRTVSTVRSLADQRGLPLIVVPHDRTLPVAENAQRLVQMILAKHKGKTTLISSHSNVIPELLRALGIANPPTIDDSTYDDLFIVAKPSVPSSEGASLIHLKYGRTNH